jgi:hypothetical protein
MNWRGQPLLSYETVVNLRIMAMGISIKTGEPSEPIGGEARMDFASPQYRTEQPRLHTGS